MERRHNMDFIVLCLSDFIKYPLASDVMKTRKQNKSMVFSSVCFYKLI